ncbi:hypothetical protein BC834DRAFT_379580 [Gloeopeniophorella convolvens]|nr:hypothetical protein BC834DRAFT_379580 [Gloeopeniophorella convolvens]
MLAKYQYRPCMLFPVCFKFPDRQWMMMDPRSVGAKSNRRSLAQVPADRTLFHRQQTQQSTLPSQLLAPNSKGADLGAPGLYTHCARQFLGIEPHTQNHKGQSSGASGMRTTGSLRSASLLRILVALPRATCHAPGDPKHCYGHHLSFFGCREGPEGARCAAAIATASADGVDTIQQQSCVGP